MPNRARKPPAVSIAVLALGAFWTASVSAQQDATFRSWNQPVAPFHILGNLYYVGTNEIAVYLLTTPEGSILLDGGFEETTPLVAASMEALGFSLDDVEILLNSHAHLDHAGGLAWLKERTGARLLAMEPDIPALESGGGGSWPFPPVEVDDILHDGDRVELGATVLTAHLTAGHTPGCTTWTTELEEGGRHHHVVFVGSATLLPQTRLVDNPDYPRIATDYARTFETLRSLPVDVFLAAHGSFFGLTDKRKQLAAGGGGEVFVDPEGYAAFVQKQSLHFRNELARQQVAAGRAP
jgi:metallo-beta-lactamase class B